MQYRGPWFDSWVGKTPWRRDRRPTPVFLGFPGCSVGKESTCSVGDLGSITSFSKADILISSLPIYMFSCLIALVRTSNKMLYKSGESKHFCPHPDLRGKSFSFSPLSMMLTVSLLYMVFIMLLHSLFILNNTHMVESFIINGYWVLSKFSESFEMIIWFLFFILLMWNNTLICRCWTICASLGSIPLDHCVWSFWCFVEFDLLIVC